MDTSGSPTEQPNQSSFNQWDSSQCLRSQQPQPQPWTSNVQSQSTQAEGWSNKSDCHDAKSHGWDSSEGFTWCDTSDWGATPTAWESPIKRWGTGAGTDADQIDKDEGMEEDFVDCSDEKSREDSGNNQYFAAQLSPKQYQKQTNEYTKAAVKALIKSPEYQRRYTTCRLCWCIWSEGLFNSSCVECGGHALQRPCPICSGKCGQTWTRDVEMSHDHNQAHWDGECGLPDDQQKMYLMQILTADPSEDMVLDAMEQLSAS